MGVVTVKEGSRAKSQWMIRSYVVTFAFVTFRIFAGKKIFALIP